MHYRSLAKAIIILSLLISAKANAISTACELLNRAYMKAGGHETLNPASVASLLENTFAESSSQHNPERARSLAEMDQDLMAAVKSIEDGTWATIIQKLNQHERLPADEMALFRKLVKLMIPNGRIGTADEAAIINDLNIEGSPPPAADKLATAADVVERFRSNFVSDQKLKHLKEKLGAQTSEIYDALKTLKISDTQQVPPEFYSVISGMAKYVRLKLARTPDKLTSQFSDALDRMESAAERQSVRRADLITLVPFFTEDVLTDLQNKARIFRNNQAALDVLRLGNEEPTDRVLQNLVSREAIARKDREWLIAVSRFKLSNYGAPSAEVEQARAMLEALGGKEINP